MMKHGILIFTLAAVALVCVSLWLVYWPFTPPEDADPVEIKVRWGASFAEVERRLIESKAVRHGSVFSLAARLTGLGRELKAGLYRFPRGSSVHHVLTSLESGRGGYVKVTLPEGLRIGQIAAVLEARLEIDSAAFVALAHDSAFIAELGIGAPSLEGYLFPETYFFSFGIGERRVIRAMVEQLRARLPRTMPPDRTLHQVLTLASIIEGEAMLAGEMDTIASVYCNRLSAGMCLQADPTIQYLIEGTPRRLLNRDLEIDSPYNTYKYAGLPPGPINSPGLDAILAAVEPAKTGYLYFVADGEGGHIFSTTLREHLRAKRRFDRIRAQVRREQSG